MNTPYKELENKEEFTTRNSIVIRNASVPQDGDDQKVVKEALAQLNIEDIVPEDDIKKVTRKGNTNRKLGSIFVKQSSKLFKTKIIRLSSIFF